MGSNRRAELIDSLRSQLDAATFGGGAVDRVTWLFAHVEDYLDRWTAFCALPKIAIRGILQSDLHTTLLIGLEFMDAEMRGIASGSPLRETWEEFTKLVRAINTQTGKDVVEQLTRSLAIVQSELARFAAPEDSELGRDSERGRS